MRPLLLATLLACAVLLATTREGLRFEPQHVAPAPFAPSRLAATPVAASSIAVRTASPEAAQPVTPAMPASPAANVAVAASRASPRRDASAAHRSASPSAAAHAGLHGSAAPRALEHAASPASQAVFQAISSQEAQVTRAPLARLYLAYFLRAPDYEGFDYYINEREEGITLESIAEEFAGSAEFHARYGELDDAAFVERIHRNVTGSPADMAQRAFWIEQLAAGRMTRGQVMLAFSESAEFQSLTGNEVFVTMAYAETLRREPAPHEFARWVDFLDAGRPRRAVIDALLAARPPGSR